jgi:hypothetical protein
MTMTWIMDAFIVLRIYLAVSVQFFIVSLFFSWETLFLIICRQCPGRQSREDGRQTDQVCLSRGIVEDEILTFRARNKNLVDTLAAIKEKAEHEVKMHYDLVWYVRNRCKLVLVLDLKCDNFQETIQEYPAIELNTPPC